MKKTQFAVHFPQIILDSESLFIKNYSIHATKLDDIKIGDLKPSIFYMNFEICLIFRSVAPFAVEGCGNKIYY